MALLQVNRALPGLFISAAVHRSASAPDTAFAMARTMGTHATEGGGPHMDPEDARWDCCFLAVARPLCKSPTIVWAVDLRGGILLHEGLIQTASSTSIRVMTCLRLGQCHREREILSPRPWTQMQTDAAVI
jgi:hypothetical protein